MIDFSVYLKSDDDIGGKERYVLTKYLRFCILTSDFLAGALFFVKISQIPKDEVF